MEKSRKNSLNNFHDKSSVKIRWGNKHLTAGFSTVGVEFIWTFGDYGIQTSSDGLVTDSGGVMCVRVWSLSPHQTKNKASSHDASNLLMACRLSRRMNWLYSEGT